MKYVLFAILAILASTCALSCASSRPITPNEIEATSALARDVCHAIGAIGGDKEPRFVQVLCSLLDTQTLEPTGRVVQITIPLDAWEALLSKPVQAPITNAADAGATPPDAPAEAIDGGKD